MEALVTWPVQISDPIIFIYPVFSRIFGQTGYPDQPYYPVFIKTEDGLGDYLAISLLDGYVELKFNLGDGFVLIKSMNPVALGKWNTIIIKR